MQVVSQAHSDHKDHCFSCMCICRYVSKKVAHLLTTYLRVIATLFASGTVVDFLGRFKAPARGTP